MVAAGGLADGVGALDDLGVHDARRGLRVAALACAQSAHQGKRQAARTPPLIERVHRFPAIWLKGRGTSLAEPDRRCGIPPGSVLLTDRGSLQARDTVLAGSSVSDVLARVLTGDDLWSGPRLAA